MNTPLTLFSAADVLDNWLTKENVLLREQESLLPICSHILRTKTKGKKPFGKLYINKKLHYLYTFKFPKDL